MESFMRRYRLGIPLSLLSALFYAAGTAYAATIVNKVGPMNISVLRMLLQGILVAPLLLKNSHDMIETTKKEWVMLVLSGLFSGIGTLVAYAAVAYIPIMDATVIFDSQAIYVLIMTFLLFKTRISILEITMTLLVVLGVVFVCQPSFIFGSQVVMSSESWKGYLFALLNIVFAGNCNIIIGKLKHLSPGTILIIQAMTTVPVLMLIGFITEQGSDPQTSSEWLELSLTVVLSAIARNLVTIALKYEAVNIAVVLLSMEIVFSMFFQIFMFGTYPNALGFSGAFCVLIGIIGVSLKAKIENLFFGQCCVKHEDAEEARLIAKEKL